jgi:glycosyltransferase involved in cell wall biosynthesis
MPISTGLNTYVIIPCFNEEFRLNIDYWNELISNLDYNWIFVNDGSNDGTRQKLDQLKNVQVLDLVTNGGKAEAIRAGINHAIQVEIKNDLVISYIDSDGAFRSNDIERIFKVFFGKLEKKEIEAVWASRVALAGRDIFRSTTRHYLSRVIISIIGAFDRDIPYDPQTGFKIFYLNKEISTLFDEKFRTRWFFDIEIIRRWERLKGNKIKIWEEPVVSWSDVKGSKVNKFQYFRIFREVLYILTLSVKK